MTTVTTFGGLALVGIGAAAVVTLSNPVNLAAAKTIAAPVLTAKPAASTNSTSASFAWTGPGGASFQCALDTPTFSPCATPNTYTVVAGSHAFQVKSLVGSDQSSPTSYNWTVDLTPPSAPTINTKPAVLSNTTSPTFGFSDTEPVVGYQCLLDAAVVFTGCSNPITYSGLAQSSHGLRVKALDAAGNVSTAAADYSWTIDTVAPPVPVITTKPSDPTVGATQTFAWSDTESGASFQCSTENGAFGTCSSPFTYVVDTSNNGQHQFAVRAVDGAGNISGQASYSYKVAKDTSVSGLQFSISGNVIQGLAPGVWRPVPLKISNPNAVPIYVSLLTVAPPADSAVPSCAGSTNLAITQANASSSNTLLVPAGGSVTLPSQGVSAPQIQLKNRPTVNQDGCKGRNFTLQYAGTANN